MRRYESAPRRRLTAAETRTADRLRETLWRLAGWPTTCRPLAIEGRRVIVCQPPRGAGG